MRAWAAFHQALCVLSTWPLAMAGAIRPPTCGCAIDKARSFSVPKDNIKQSAEGDRRARPENFEEVILRVTAPAE